MCGEAVVKLKKVSFRYGSEESGQSQHESLKSIDLVIPDVESVLLIGPSGCGKTKILRLIKSETPLCFMVMQDSGNQLFTESVLEEVLISLPKNTPDEKARAMEILRQLDLEDFCDRHPQSLSGGQKQRLAIACALASGREILLLDEPTSGLDQAHMAETAMLLKQLCRTGTTILLVTHDSEMNRACCDRILRFGA